MKASSPFSALISYAFSRAPRMPCAGSVSTRSAQKALSRVRRSVDMEEGIVRISL